METQYPGRELISKTEMTAEERDVLRIVRSLSRLILQLLHSTFNEFLLSSPLITFPLPTESQYGHLKALLTHLSLVEEEGDRVGVEEVVEAARTVLGVRAVERISNNISLVTSCSQDYLQDILQPEEL